MPFFESCCFPWNSPPIVCVFPDPVWPYAKHVAMPPSKMLWTRDLAVYL